MKTKIRFWILSSILGVSSLVLVTNCTKKDNTKDANIPVLTTNEVTDVTATTATSGGVVTSDGGANVTEQGVCWSTNQNPTTGDDKTSDDTAASSFTSSITGLTAKTTYYVRAYATNSNGTGYGSAISFTTPEGTSTVQDIDGNIYKTVTIGTQTWMVENLKTTKYNDGTEIPNVTDASAWSGLTTGALCDYDNIPSNSETYGKLYNWYAVNTGKLCPNGWHVPTDDDWTTLFDFLGGTSVASGKLKETGTVHWISPNNEATNETGFLALPGGYRNSHGSFAIMGYYGYWWSATEYIKGNASDINIGNNTGAVFVGYDVEQYGYSVRCVKN